MKIHSFVNAIEEIEVKQKFELCICFALLDF